MRAGNQGHISVMHQALGTTTCSFVYKRYSSIGIGCFTQHLYKSMKPSDHQLQAIWK